MPPPGHAGQNKEDFVVRRKMEEINLETKRSTPLVFKEI